MTPRPLRIAYIINSLEGGGAASPVPAITRVLREGGATVKIFALTGRDRRGLAAMLTGGLEVEVREDGETDHLAALKWLDRRLVAWQPTHLWTSLTRATLLGQAVGALNRWPVVSWQHAAYLKPANRLLLRATQRASRLWIGDSSTVTRLTAARLGVPAHRLVTWPIFCPEEDKPRARAWQPGEPIRVGSLGRLHPVKGYDVLVDALARLPAGLPPLKVIVAGEGAQREPLTRQAAAADVTVLHLPGYTADPGRFLADCHLYVQPSRSEGLCVAAHEAMVAGLPVIASRVGELPETIVDGVSGLLVAPGDPDQLANAIVQLVNKPERLAELGAAGRERVLARFGTEAFRATGLSILQRLRAM